MTSPAIYLDHHATTACDPAVVEAMLPHFTETFGNAASRTHAYGTAARAATEVARADVAALIGASPKEIIFTSGATEANNLALLGAARSRRSEGRTHVLTVATEHPSVLDPCRALVDEGFDVTVLPVGPDGLCDPDVFAASLRPTTAVASVMRVNSEIGVLQPLEALIPMAHGVGAWFHTDAAQTLFVPTDVEALEVDLLSLSAHKLHGPMGVGALFVRRKRPRIVLKPLQYGGGHERGLRSGTLPVPMLVGFGVAARLVMAGRPIEVDRVRSLRDQLLEGLRKRVPTLTVNASVVLRAPNNLNVRFPGVEAAALLMAVRREVALSTGSACSSEDARPSPVLAALGLPADAAQESVRFGLGRFTTAADIDRAVLAVGNAVDTVRGLSQAFEGDA